MQYEKKEQINNEPELTHEEVEFLRIYCEILSDIYLLINNSEAITQRYYGNGKQIF